MMQEMVLNKEQARELARFLLDVAKGLILGGVGFGVVAPFEIKILAGGVSLILVYALVRFSLSLLKEV